MGKSKKYSKITYEMRRKLIQFVCEDGIPCVVAGKQLGISASTAKMIVKKFRENGEIFEKKQEKLIREHLDEYKASIEVQTNCMSPLPPQNANMNISFDNSLPFLYYMPFQFPEMFTGINYYSC